MKPQNFRIWWEWKKISKCEKVLNFISLQTHLIICDIVQFAHYVCTFKASCWLQSSFIMFIQLKHQYRCWKPSGMIGCYGITGMLYCMISCSYWMTLIEIIIIIGGPVSVCHWTSTGYDSWWFPSLNFLLFYSEMCWCFHLSLPKYRSTASASNTYSIHCKQSKLTISKYFQHIR